jgi:hypothetical protein
MDFELLTLLHKVSVKVISRRLAKRKYRYEIDTVDAEEFTDQKKFSSVFNFA